MPGALPIGAKDGVAERIAETFPSGAAIPARRETVLALLEIGLRHTDAELCVWVLYYMYAYWGGVGPGRPA